MKKRIPLVAIYSIGWAETGPLSRYKREGCGVHTQ